jgi:hypothetical protein
MDSSVAVDDLVFRALPTRATTASAEHCFSAPLALRPVDDAG